MARERLDEERQKKLKELQEQQTQAQLNREKQLETRRKKIEDVRRRDVERRVEVEKRRREMEVAEKVSWGQRFIDGALKFILFVEGTFVCNIYRHIFNSVCWRILYVKSTYY